MPTPQLCCKSAVLRDKIRTAVEKYFERCRFDNKYHLGLGDIRLTIGMQEEILEIIADCDTLDANTNTTWRESVVVTVEASG